MKTLLCFLFIAFPTVSAGEILEGIAKNQKGEIVYLEKHTIKLDAAGLNRLIEVIYTTPNGRSFATMTSDFSNSKTVPDTIFEDSRFKTKISMRLINKSVTFEETKNGKRVSKKEFPLNEQMVASQGFDNFIKINSSKLEAGPVDFKFGVLDSKDFYSLTGYKKNAATSDEIEYGIKASTWFVRLFAGELRVSYDVKDKKIRSFSGRSNIKDNSGNSQDVFISYKWKNEP